MSIKLRGSVEPATNDTSLARKLPILLASLLLGILYCALFQSYRAYEIDNPWYLSFSHGWWLEGHSTDWFLNGKFPDGMGGTEVFGRLAAATQGLLLTPLHWTAFAATLLSTALVLAGLLFWYLFLRSQGFTQVQCSAMVFALGLTEPFVGMAERFRYEPMCFALMAAGFLMASRQRTSSGLLLAFCAAEIEPVGAIAGLLLLLYLYRSHREDRYVLAQKAVAAAVLFLIIYLLLHPHILHVLAATDWHGGSGQRQFGGFLRAYFISRTRHLPELALLLVASVALVRNYGLAPPFVRRSAELLLLVILFSFAMQWPTPAYMVFFYPFAVPLCLWTLQLRWQHAWLLSAIACLIFLPQYAAVAYLNRGEGFSGADQRAVANAIKQAEHDLELDDDHLQIMGDYTLWFAHPRNYRALSRTTLASVSTANLFLCFDRPLQAQAMVDPIVRYCGDVRSLMPTREVGTLMVRSHRLHLLAPAGRQSTH